MALKIWTERDEPLKIWSTDEKVPRAYENLNLAWCQFHQRFTRAFFVQKSFLCLEFGFERTFVLKIGANNFDEIDHWSFNIFCSCTFRQNAQPSTVWGSYKVLVCWTENFLYNDNSQFMYAYQSRLLLIHLLSMIWF